MQQTKKTGKKIKTRQQIKKGRSKRCCRRQSTWLIINPLLHRCRTDIAMLSLRCRSTVAPLSHRYHSAVALSQSLRCCAAVAPLLHRYHSTVTPLISLLLSLLLSLHSSTAFAPILLHCCSAAVAPAVAVQSLLLSHPLLLHCRAVVEPLSLRTIEGIKNPILNCCCSTVTPLSLLLSIGSDSGVTVEQQHFNFEFFFYTLSGPERPRLNNGATTE